MSKEISVASVYLDDHQAGQKLKELSMQAETLALRMHELRKANDKAGYDKARKEWREATRELSSYKRTVIDVTKVMNTLSGQSQRTLTKTSKILRNEISLMNRETKEEIALYNAKVSQLKRVDAELNNVRMEMRSLNATQQGWLSRSANAFNKYSMVVASAAATLMGMVLAFKNAIKQADEFEENLSHLSSLTGIVGPELQYFAKEAKNLSVTTTDSGVRISQSAADILDAYKRMGSARPDLLENKEALAEVTKNAIILSEAATMDVLPATNALATSLNQFNAEASESERHMNAMAAGSKYGAGEIDYIAAAMEKFGTAANLAGVDIEESIAIVETIAPKFAQPSAAGTMLRNIFIRLQSGIDAFNPKVVGMKNVLDNLAEANLSVAEKVKLFGLRNINAAETLILYRDQMQIFKDVLTDTNVATEQAAINTNNHSSKIDQAKNKLNLVSIELGSKLAPVMTFSTNSATYLIKATLKAIATFYKYRGVITTAVVAIVAYNIAANLMVIKLKLIALWTRLAATATSLFGKALKTSGLGLFVAILSAAATAYMFLRDELTKTTKAQKDYNDEVKRGKDLLEGSKSLNDRFKLIFKMSASQINRFKEDVQLQLTEIDKMNENKLLAEQKYIQEVKKWNDWLNLSKEGSNERYYKARDESMQQDMLNAQKTLALITQSVENANADQLQSYIKIADDRLALIGVDPFTNVDPTKETKKSKTKFDPRNLGGDELSDILEYNKFKADALKESRQQDLIDLDDSFQAQERLRQIAHNEELQKLGSNLKARETLEEQFRKDSIARQVAYLQHVIAQTQTLIDTGGIDGLSLEEAFLSDEERDSLLEKIEELKLKISELNVQLIPDPANKTDVLGMTQDEWDKFQLNMQAAFEIAGAIHDIWANINQAQNNQEAAAFDKYLQHVEKKKEILDTQKEKGLITEQEYADQVAAIDQEVIQKRKKLEHDAAARERETAIFSILLNTAMGIMNVWAQWSAMPPVAATLTALVAAMGATQMAALPPVPQYALGNYANVIGASDGKSYNAQVVDSHKSGFFNKPTFIKGFGLVGDTPKRELVFNPVDTQKIIDSNFLLRAINETLDVPQFAEGNRESFTQDSVSNNYMYTDPLLLDALKKLNAKLDTPLLAILLANEDYARKHKKIMADVDSLHSAVDH